MRYTQYNKIKIALICLFILVVLYLVKSYILNINLFEGFSFSWIINIMKFW